VTISDTAANDWADALTTLQNAGAGDTSGAADFFAKLDSLPIDPYVLDIFGAADLFLAYTHPVCGK
jgi:hypothetical protein